MKTKESIVLFLALLTASVPALADSQAKESSAKAPAAEEVSAAESPATKSNGKAAKTARKKTDKEAKSAEKGHGAEPEAGAKKTEAAKNPKKKTEKVAAEKKSAEKKSDKGEAAATEMKKAAVPAAKTDLKHTEPAPVLVAPSFYDVWIKGRLSIGPTYTKVSVQDTHIPYREDRQGLFIGNINDMQEDGTTGFGLAIRYELLPWLAVELAGLDRADLRACNEDGMSCDGTLEIRSWRAQGFLQWPFETVPVTVYAGAGAANVDTKFSHAPWWHYGWSSPENYDKFANGSTKPRNGVMREMDVDDAGYALVATVGATLRLHDHLHLDVFWEKVDSDDVDVDFYRVMRQGKSHMLSGHFPTGYTAIGASLRYVF